MADTDLVVRNTMIWSRSEWTGPADIVIKQGQIRAIGPHEAQEAIPGSPILEAAGCHALPGFVNTHTHLFQALLRGIADGKGLHEWLLPVGEAYVAATPEQAYVASACAAAELLRSGATTVVEHGYPHPNRDVHDAIIAGLQDVGVRAVYCRGIADKSDPDRWWGFEPRLMEPYDNQLAHVEELVRRFGTDQSRIRAGLAPANPRALSPEGMREARALSDRLDLCVSMHLCETDVDDRACMEHVGKPAIAYLDDNDFLWDRFLGVHCVRVQPRERITMAARHCGVSYNPVSNLRLGSGIAPIPEFLQLGVPVGIGVDGAASNDTQDMFETIRYGSYVQRGRLVDARVMDAPVMIRMATSGCNQVLGIPSMPSGLEPGQPADIALVRFERDLSSVPVFDPSVTLLTQATNRVVEAVIVAGEVTVRDGRCVRVNEEDLLASMVKLTGRVPGRARAGTVGPLLAERGDGRG